MSELQTYPNRVGGTFATGREDDAMLSVMSPHTDRPVAWVRDSSPSDVARAVEAAHNAFEGSHEWRHTTPRQRSHALLGLANMVEENADQLIDLEVAQTGKLFSQMRDVEMPHLIDTLRFFAGAARTRTAPTGRFMEGTLSQVLHSAVGVVGVITPWNFPLMMAAWKLGPILAAGCTVVMKPDPKTPLTTLLLAEMAEDLLPPGTINVVTGGTIAGRSLADDPSVHMVTLTGSQRAGQDVATEAGRCLKPTHLELGGNCPVIVFEDAWQLAAEMLVDPIVFNTGAACAAPSRLYFVGSTTAYEDFAQALGEGLSARRPGMPDDPNADFGAAISHEHAAHIGRMLDDHTGTFQTDAGRGLSLNLKAGSWLTPQLVYNVRQDDRVVQEELFGPAVSLQHAASAERAVQLANGVRFGLAASVWTHDPETAWRTASLLNAGEVWVNTHLEQTPELPHGGARGSGWGVDLSAAAIDDYSYLKTLTRRTV
jgi:betaine-aldehyde dehydrogenase